MQDELSAERGNSMTTLPEYLERLGIALDPDYQRAALQQVVQRVMEVEVSMQLDAGHYERSDKRTAYRNGYRVRRWATSVGELALRIPKLRRGTYSPAFMIDDASVEALLLHFVEALYVHGAQPNAAAHLLAALDIPPMNRSLIADLCAQLDDLAWRFRERPLEDRYPYIWLDWLTLSTGERLMVAVGVMSDGTLALLGCEIGANWRAFLRRLRARGLQTVCVVISDDHSGAHVAVEETFLDARWQFCRAYALADILRHVPQPDRGEVVIAISNIFLHTGYESAAEQLRRVIEAYQLRFPQAVVALVDAGSSFVDFLQRGCPAKPIRTGWTMAVAPSGAHHLEMTAPASCLILSAS
jgi:transposase-like protein